MDKLLFKQPFYNNITKDTEILILDLFKCYKKKKLMNNISIYIYFLVGIIFLISFKEIVFEKIYISNINTIFELCKSFTIIGGLLATSNILTKKSCKEFEKSLKKLKSFLVIDICTCKNKCHCKTEMIKFLSSLGFYLI